MVAPTCFGFTSSDSALSAFWETLNWGAVDRILWMGVLCLVAWCAHHANSRSGQFRGCARKSPFARFEVLKAVELKMSSVPGCHAVSTGRVTDVSRERGTSSSGSSMDRAMVPVDRRRPLVRSQHSPCGNFGQQTGNGTGFHHVHHLCIVGIILPTLRPHKFFSSTLHNLCKWQHC
jgi:hypothetical protein